MPGPLAGVTVVEAAQVISGPLGGMLLAQQGARVIKIEPPGAGDPTRVSGHRRAGIGATFANVNRGKESVVIDATTPEGRDLVVGLAAKADVFTQNFRPGKAAKMGIGPEQLQAANPSLIYVSIYGFGADGPYAEQKVYDFVMQGALGYADAQRDPSTGRPTLIRNYLVDKATSYQVAQAISTALFARERRPDRRGQHVELAMLDVGLEFFWVEGMLDHTYLEEEGTEYVPLNLGFYDCCDTADGAIAILLTVPSFFAGLCNACGHPEWIIDPRFANVLDRRRNMHEFVALAGKAIGAMTTAEAIAKLQAHDVAVSEVLGPADIPAHPQVIHNQVIVQRDDPNVGRIQAPRHAVHFADTPAEGPGDVPAHGEHTAKVLADVLGLSDAEIAKLQDAGVVGGAA